MQGDLTGLSVQERLQFYKALCRSLGLNPLTRPFEYIVFSDKDPDESTGAAASGGKMTLYARADCAAQLRKIHKVGISKDMRRVRDGEFYKVEADAIVHDIIGGHLVPRTDTSTGIVWLKKVKFKNGARQVYELEGRDLANAMMKAETKAKRRVTFSICGLHILDESEIEDLTQLTFDVSESGRVVEILPPASQPALQEPGEDLYDLACTMARRDPESSLQFKVRVANHLAEIQKLTPAQRQIVADKYKETEPSSQPVREPAAKKEEGSARPAKAAPPTGAPETAPTEPSSYGGITLQSLKNGAWWIRGMVSVLHEHRDLLAPYWNANAKPPSLICSAEQAGALCRRLEERQIKFRMVSDG